MNPATKTLRDLFVFICKKETFCLINNNFRS